MKHIVNHFAKLLFLIILFAFVTFHSAFSQDSTKAVNFSSKLKLEKHFTIHHPSNLEITTLKIKARDGKIYLLNDNFIYGKGLVLFAMNIQSNRYDTSFISIDQYAINISDFDVCDGKLYLLIDQEISVYDLIKKSIHNTKLKFPNKSTYRHFYASDSVTVLFYEWQIGDKKFEEKCVYKYHLNSNQWEIFDQNLLDGLGFLGTYGADKHIDLNSNMLVKFSPDRYEIPIYNLKTGRRDTISRYLDTNLLISGDFIRRIHDKYRMKSKSSLFDSLDRHCFSHARLRSLRVCGDSIIYVLYYNEFDSCQYVMTSRKITAYLDAWKFNPLTEKWELYFANMRLDNRAECKKIDISKLNNLNYSLLEIESQWCVYENYLIIPKKMPDIVDLNGDISPYYKRENFNAGLNLQLMVFKLPFSDD